MRCRRFHDHGAGQLEQGRRDLEHLIACRVCRRLDEGYRAVGDAIAALPTAEQPDGAWQARVFARIARGADRPSTTRWHRSRVWLASIYAVVLVVVGVMSASAYAGDLRARSTAEATMERVAQALDTSIARLEVDEAEDDLRFQIVHVAYAEARAAAPDADVDDVALAEARQRALQTLRKRHATALSTLATVE